MLWVSTVGVVKISSTHGGTPLRAICRVLQALSAEAKRVTPPNLNLLLWDDADSTHPETSSHVGTTQTSLTSRLHRITRPLPTRSNGCRSRGEQTMKE